MKLNGVRTLLLLVVVALSAVSNGLGHSSPSLLPDRWSEFVRPTKPTAAHQQQRRAAFRSERTRPVSLGHPDIPAARDARSVCERQSSSRRLRCRAAHFVAAAQHHRAENAAHAEVVKALADFQKAQPK